MVTVRGATSRDVDAYVAIQEEEWGEKMAATPAQIRSRIEVFRAGLLVAEHDGAVVAAATFIRLAEYDVGAGESWHELTADGWCTTHVPGGSVLFGVDMSVSRRGPRSTSMKMFGAGLELTMRLGTEGVYWGSRLPRYHRYQAKMPAQEYIRARNKRGRYLDPELELYSRVPGVELLGVVDGYFDDWESADYGAILRWPNPIQRYPFLRPFAAQIRQGLYRRDRRRRRRL